MYQRLNLQSVRLKYTLARSTNYRLLCMDFLLDKAINEQSRTPQFMTMTISKLKFSGSPLQMRQFINCVLNNSQILCFAEHLQPCVAACRGLYSETMNDIWMREAKYQTIFIVYSIRTTKKKMYNYL